MHRLPHHSCKPRHVRMHMIHAFTCLTINAAGAEDHDDLVGLRSMHDDLDVCACSTGKRVA